MVIMPFGRVDSAGVTPSAGVDQGIIHSLLTAFERDQALFEGRGGASLLKPLAIRLRCAWLACNGRLCHV